METCVFLVYLSGSEYFFFREYFFIFKIKLISISTHKSDPTYHYRLITASQCSVTQGAKSWYVCTFARSSGLHPCKCVLAFPSSDKIWQRVAIRPTACSSMGLLSCLSGSPGGGGGTTGSVEGQSCLGVSSDSTCSNVAAHASRYVSGPPSCGKIFR